MPTLDELRRRYARNPADSAPRPSEAPEAELPGSEEWWDDTLGPPSSGRRAGSVDVDRMRSSRFETLDDSAGSPFPEKKKAKGRALGRYKIAADGKDALLHFGRYKDQQLSAILRSGRDGRGYLKWMLDGKQDFPSDLLDVVRYLLAEYDKEEAAARAIDKTKLRGT